MCRRSGKPPRSFPTGNTSEHTKTADYRISRLSANRRFKNPLDFFAYLANAARMLEGETLAGGAPKTCPDCGVAPPLEVLKSAAGYYIGTRCECGPYSRESLYYAIREIADRALRDGTWTPREPNL